MKKHALVAAVASLVASAGASAQTTTVFDLTSGAFANTYTFSVASASTVTGDTNSAGISWLGVLLQNPAAGYTALDGNPDDGFTFTGLSAGTYALTFLGSGKGGYGGFYTVTTAVPEPESVAMMLAGLGLIGLLARRRRA